MLQQGKFLVMVLISIVVFVILQQIVRHSQTGGRFKWHRFLTPSDMSYHHDNDVLGVMRSLYGLMAHRRFYSKGWSTNGSHNHNHKSQPKPKRRTPQYKSIVNPFYFIKDPVYRGRDFAFRINVAGKRLMDQQIKHLQHSITHGALNIALLASLHLNGTLQQFERWVVEEEPIDEVKELADEMMSQVTLLNSTGSDVRVGDVVTIRVDVFNGQNVPLLRGGDEIRVWVKDSAQMASMAVGVEDLMNGSYVAHVPLMWAGHSSIFVSLTYPREILRAILYIRTVMKAVRLNAAGFRSAGASETTLCSPFPITYINNGHGLCNMTKANYGMSWFCGKPTNPDLTCDNWTDIRDLDFPNPLPMANGERAWFDRIWTTEKYHYLRTMSSSVIKLEVQESTVNVLKARPLCSRRPPRDTWLEKSPKGMIYQMTWIPFGCRLLHINSTILQQRLSKHTVYMVGDSNLRIWQEVLFKNHVCNVPNVKVDKVTRRQHLWHDPTDCINVQHNFVIKWVTHTLPFHTNPTHWAGRGNMKSVATTLDGIPPVERLIVVIHLYIHFSTHHASVYHDRVRSMRDAVARFVERIPSAKVVIRGPHVAYKEWPSYLGGDAQGPMFRQILINEFEDLYDKVIFLDFWDMSIAGENKEFHPSVFLTSQMMNVFFSYVLE